MEHLLVHGVGKNILFPISKEKDMEHVVLVLEVMERVGERKG